MARPINEFNQYDEDGNRILHVVKFQKNKLGGGWVAFYKRAIRSIIDEVPNLATLRVYLYIASKQTYQKFAMVARKAICKDLTMHINTVTLALKWLKQNEYLQEHEIDGNTGWLLNPNVTTCGAKLQKSKGELWNLEKKRQMAKLDEDIANREEVLRLLDSMIAKNLVEDEFEGDDDVVQQGPFGEDDSQSLQLEDPAVVQALQNRSKRIEIFSEE